MSFIKRFAEHFALQGRVGVARVAMAAQPLAALFEKDNLIKKRFRVKGYFVDFPPRRGSGGGDDDEDSKKENPISTRAMEMNCAALKVMFSFFRVTSGKRVPIQKLEAAATCPTRQSTSPYTRYYRLVL